MPDVLVNYRTADARFGAAATYELLSARLGKERLFLDNQSIPPGASYAAEIRRVLESIRVLLVLIGPAWLVEDPESPGRLLIERDDDWVAREIRRAIERGIPIVPVLMDGSALPDPVVLPHDLRPLVLRQAVEIRHHRLGEDINRLADYLAPMISSIASGVARTTELPGEPGIHRATEDPAETLPIFLIAALRRGILATRRLLWCLTTLVRRTRCVRRCPDCRPARHW